MSGIWPGDTRCVVMLGFDVDGVSGAINQRPETSNLPSFMSMREYGPSIATPRILDLLDVHLGGSGAVDNLVYDPHPDAPFE